MRNLLRQSMSRRAITLVVILAAASLSAGIAVAASGDGGSRSPSAAPVSTAPPTIHGALTRGATLSGDPGEFVSDAPPLTFFYRWFRCTSSGGACTPIASATQADYVLQTEDVGQTVLLQVTAVDSDGVPSSAVNSATTAPVQPAEDPPVAPDNIAPPQVGGSPVQGETLTALTGLWNGFPVPFFTYLWQRCGPTGNGCNPINGATSPTFVLSALDVASTFRVQVTATSSAGTESATSAASSIVTIPLGPMNTQLPMISGTAKTGETLTSTTGQWSGAIPITFTREWRRCNAQGQGCVAITGATQAAYVVQAVDEGQRIQVVVTAKNGDGEASATSALTAVVESGVPVGGTIPVSQVSLPNRLVITGVDYEPNRLRSRAPFIARFRVSDSEGHFVSGADVFLLTIPFGRIAAAPIVKTDASGWATFTLQPTAKLPLHRGGLTAVYARATKPGDSVLGGVSTRRLSSIRSTSPNR
jgi:hypothetical protein